MKEAALAIADEAVDGSQHDTSRGRASDELLDCGCNLEAIRAFHGYLSEHFPGYVLRHFHAASRAMQTGFPPVPADHHSIRIARADVLPYYVVLMDDFRGWSVQEVWEHLRHVDLADTVRGHRIAVVSQDGASAL